MSKKKKAGRPKDKDPKIHRKRLTDAELKLVEDYRGVKQVAIQTGTPIEDIDFYWDKSSSDYSVNIKNRFYQPRNQASTADIDFTGVFDSLVTPVVIPERIKKPAIFDRLVYTDAHIGMNPNPDGYSLYGGKWDEEEIMHRNQIMINHTIAKQDSRKLYIDDLGDFMDGWNKQTVRGGHDLPQNMTNQEAYDCGVKFKVMQIDSLMQHYDEIEVRNITDDNHAGAFAYTVNQAFKNYIELKYPGKVTVINQRKFVDYYENEDNNIFMLTHGKDGVNMKFGFKPKLDDKQIAKIKNIIDDNFLMKPNTTIEFSKGDSHQYLFDNSSSDAFNYYNYPAFSPSSGWVQTNYQKGLSGFVHFNYYENAPKSINEYIFDWVK